MLVSTLAAPVPAAEPAAQPIESTHSKSKSHSKTKSKIVSRMRHAVVRYRGVPTYADSFSTDDATYDADYWLTRLEA